MAWDRFVERLYHRAVQTVGRCLVSLVDDTGPVQFLQVQLGPDEYRDKLMRIAEFGLASNPPVGAHGVAIFVGGDRSNGVVVATGDTRYRPKNLAPGEVQIYDASGKFIYLTENGGIVINAGGQNVTIENAPTTVIAGDVQIGGKVTAAGDGVFDGHSVSNHRHGGVQSGAGTSGTPVG